MDAAPPALEPPHHSAAFLRRRRANWLVLGLTYATMYMGRYNFGLVNKTLSDAYGFDKTQIGTIISTASAIYGVSAIFNGPIADRIGGRKAMLIGVFGAVVFNIAFGLGAYLGAVDKKTLMLAYFATVWSLNQYFQSYSALSLIKVNASWFHIAERGRFSAIFGSMIQSGRAGILSLGGILAAWLAWQWIFFVPAAIMLVMGILTYLVVQDSPEKAGHAAFDTQDASSGDEGKVDLAYVAKKVFTNPITLTIAAAEFCTGVVRKGFEEWFPTYMQEHLHLRTNSGVFQKGAWSIVIAGIAGAFAAGYASDIFFKNRRPPVALIGYALQIIALITISIAPSTGAIIAAFVINSFAVSVVHSMLSGTASMDFGGKKAAATAAGMFDGMQYVGGVLAGIPLGWVIKTYGWRGWGPSMAIFSFIGLILMSTLWNARPARGGGGH
ncbi:Glycerol-3-phosphate transporter [Minicystis rosea]|nr:Glycerol-3-phosphate transporter [Minicystis rosea]